MGKISTRPRYGIGISGTDLLSLGESGGGVHSKKLEKMRVFFLRKSDRILLKFPI